MSAIAGIGGARPGAGRAPGAKLIAGLVLGGIAFGLAAGYLGTSGGVTRVAALAIILLPIAVWQRPYIAPAVLMSAAILVEQTGQVPAIPITERVPLFQAIGRRTFEVGPEPAAAAAIKLTNNFVLGCAIEVIGEAYALVEKFGVERAVMYDVLTDGLFSAPAYKVYGKIILDEAYDKVGQSAVNGFKDAELALAAGAGAGVPLPSVSVWRDRLLSAIAHGDGGKDWAVMALEQARASGLRR